MNNKREIVYLFGHPITVLTDDTLPPGTVKLCRNPNHAEQLQISERLKLMNQQVFAPPTRSNPSNKKGAK